MQKEGRFACTSTCTSTGGYSPEMLLCHATSIRTELESIVFPSIALLLNAARRAVTTSRLAAACSAAVRACPINRQRSFVSNSLSMLSPVLLHANLSSHTLENIPLQNHFQPINGIITSIGPEIDIFHPFGIAIPTDSLEEPKK